MSSIMAEGGEQPKRKKKKKFDIKSMPQIPWTESRPQPELTPGIWPDETAYELYSYIDWHRSHPHCVSPRNPDAPGQPGQAKFSGKIYHDEENPNLIYTKNGTKLGELPNEFLPPQLGVNCDTDEVSTIAMKSEYKKVISYITEYDDPWYNMSVKDQLEQSHVDGSHTTVKTKRSKPPPMTEFDRNAAWQKEQYGQYEGGYPAVTQSHAQRLEELSLQDKFLLHDTTFKKKKVGPWEQEYVFSKYTAEGTALDEYDKVKRYRNVDDAVSLYEEECAMEVVKQKESLSSKSGKSGKSRKSKKNQVVPINEDPILVMKRKIGTDKEIEKMNKKLLKLAIKVTKKAKINKSVIDTSMDLVEACEKLRVVKVLSMLVAGVANPNMKTADDEPLFAHLIGIAVKQDLLSGNLHPPPAAAPTTGFRSRFLSTNSAANTASTYSETVYSQLKKTLTAIPVQQDSPDRKKLQRILTVLLQYNANINVYNRDGLTALHLAAKTDNSKLVQWLCQQPGIDVNKESKQEHMSALMYGAKYGNVKVLAELIKIGMKENVVNRDGHTALHYAAMYGQSRPAQFLLRIGTNKKLRDVNGKVAAELAADNGFQTTAQLISAFAVTKVGEAAAQLDYLMHIEVDPPPADNSYTSYMSTMFSLRSVTEGMKSMGKFLRKKMVRAYHYFRNKFGLDEEEKPDDDEEEEETLEGGEEHKETDLLAPRTITNTDNNNNQSDDQLQRQIDQLNGNNSADNSLFNDDVVPF